MFSLKKGDGREPRKTILRPGNEFSRVGASPTPPFEQITPIGNTFFKPGEIKTETINNNTVISLSNAC